MADYGGGEYAMMADAAGDGLPPVSPSPPASPSPAGALDSRLSLVRRVPAVLSGVLTLRRGRLGRSVAGCWAEVRSGVLLVYGNRGQAAAGATPPALMLPLDGEAVVQKFDAYHSDGSLRHAVDERLVAELATGGSPYVLALRHAFQTPSALYLVSEWCGGGDLRSALRRRPGGTLSRSEAVRLLSQLVVAVGVLHRLGVVHRDIKAENVFLASAPPVAADGGPDLSAAVIRLGDMGLAKKLPAGRHGRTRSFCGTDEYMAPEVVLGRPYGTAVDWWSLGVLAARLLTGRLPYTGPPGGRPATNHRLFESIVTEEPNLPAGLDAHVEALLRGLLHQDESHRWGEARYNAIATPAWEHPPPKRPS
ncbi:hypothetical protein I4F81_003966 [Pyropia yezoensis]|uniref:Uncharacterized protein n=1 Tax=Pyropia yezoensis TaxID=2788 RepID=A0ACC3BU45_PYRYE|nr:hypothetical protein I4F81_003966 [Neopyropia yezoensis]